MNKTLLCVLASLLISGCSINQISDSAGELAAAASTVKVDVDQGHGSGVVVSKDLVITAKHVVKDQTNISILFSDGTSSPGRVLWTSTDEADVALISASTLSIPAAKVDCGPQKRGTRVLTHGYPMRLSSVTTWGRIASEVADENTTEGGVVLDLTVLSGSSGGGVWTVDGRLVGLADAVIPMMSSWGRAPTGISVMVPGSIICRSLQHK